MEFTWFATAWDNDDLLHRLGMLAAMLLVIVLAAGIPGSTRATTACSCWPTPGMQVLLVLMFARVLPPRGPAHAVRAQLHGRRRDRRADHARVAVGRSAAALLGLGARRGCADGRRRCSRCAPTTGSHSTRATSPSATGCSRSSCSAKAWWPSAVGLGEVRFDGGAVASALLGFGIAAAIWWSYFETVSSSSLSRERIWASFLWGYGHLFGFAGIAAAAVGVELAIEAGAAGDHGLSLAARLMLCAGAAAFLLSLVAVHTAEIGVEGRRHGAAMGAIVALLVLAFVARGWPPAWWSARSSWCSWSTVVLRRGAARRARASPPTTCPTTERAPPAAVAFQSARARSAPTRRAGRRPRPRGWDRVPCGAP